MHNNTFEDYKKAIKAKYEVEKEGVYFNFLSPPSPANLRNLCWERFKSNESKNDLNVFSSFFQFEFDLTKRKSFNDQTDRFRPIGSFLKGEKAPSNRFAVELAAVLVDYEPRPFKKFKEIGLIPEKRPMIVPEIPLPFNGYDPNDTDEIEDDEIKNYLEDGLLNNNQGIFLDNFRNRFSKKFTKKIIRVFITILLVFSLIATAIYFAFTRKQCMQWSNDHYDKVDCDLKVSGFISSNGVEPYDDNKFGLKKITVYDTTACFKNGEAIIWYAKIGNDKADFFNTHGRHPENDKPLRPVTRYILDKYAKKTTSKK
ncbi:hypothetical protein [Flavobacterium sp. KJJ]|uniref:hypothetical protein n=1 Tax=Flavobacterium sp. KJJ TaxID=1270193 RepID=UPI00069045FA|nr:hypothetical protein [Flavobacterium sp. KJJ]